MSLFSCCLVSEWKQICLLPGSVVPEPSEPRVGLFLRRQWNRCCLISTDQILQEIWVCPGFLSLPPRWPERFSKQDQVLPRRGGLPSEQSCQTGSSIMFSAPPVKINMPHWLQLSENRTFYYEEAARRDRSADWEQEFQPRRRVSPPPTSLTVSVFTSCCSHMFTCASDVTKKTTGNKPESNFKEERTRKKVKSFRISRGNPVFCKEASSLTAAAHFNQAGILSSLLQSHTTTEFDSFQSVNLHPWTAQPHLLHMSTPPLLSLRWGCLLTL